MYVWSNKLGLLCELTIVGHIDGESIKYYAWSNEFFHYLDTGGDTSKVASRLGHS